MIHSLWTESTEHPVFQTLRQDLKTDVLIIGGGITGILCAYMLQLAGVDCVLAEADRICSGITQNTTAKITLQHGLIYDRMIRRFGCDTARLYLQAQQAALMQYRHLCSSIACGFEERDSYVYSCRDPEILLRETEALHRIGCPAEYVESIPIPVAARGAIRVPEQAQFHPLQFAYSLARGLPIYENTIILELLPGGARTEHGKISAEKTIIATHFPILNKHGAYFLKLYQHRSYVLALKDAPEIDGMYVDEDAKGMSFRSHNGLLLLGGGGHRTGKQGGNWRELTSFARQEFPAAREVCRWAAQDCMTLDDIPYIGRYSRHTQDMYVATGFNKWGMTSSMTAAILLCDLIQGKENRFAPVFQPSRYILRPQLAINTAEALLGLLTPTVPRCPHMGCALKYNPDEHSWDCSCHGSRFAENGKRLDNPATDDKSMSLPEFR